MTKYNIAIVGATGLVGSTLLEILQERKFPVNNIYLLASERSLGDRYEFEGKYLKVESLEDFDFNLCDLVFFCVSNHLAQEYIPKAVKANAIVIDKSSLNRYDPEIPLIVPEVNLEDLKLYTNKNIISNPNCNVIPVMLALKPIHDAVGISRINIATYQSVSGSGKQGINELAEQTAQLLNAKPIKPKLYADQIAFNIIPCIEEVQENGYTKEEIKIVKETRKILHDDTIGVNPTTVRVPVFFGHSAAVTIDTHDKITVEKANELLKKFPGVEVNSKPGYATPASQAAGKDAVFVGRIREDISTNNGLSMWVVTDNIRKGAALNAVQIAESLINMM